MIMIEHASKKKNGKLRMQSEPNTAKLAKSNIINYI